MANKNSTLAVSKIPKLRFPGFSGVWEEKRLGEVAKIIDGDRGVNYPNGNDFSSEEYCLFLNAKNVTKQGFLFEEKSFITKEKDEKLRKGKLQRNDLILTTRGSVGHVAFYNTQVLFENIRINSGMVLVREEKKNIKPDFLYKFLTSKKIENKIQRISFGSAQPQLTVKEINNLKIEFSSLPEQQKIADFLGATDAWIENLREQKQTLESYKKGMMQKIFSQEIRFKDEKREEFPNWEEKNFSDVLVSVSIKNYQIKTADFLEEGNFPVVDQGMRQVAGFSNDRNKVYNKIPVIVFGDHTTVLKYIDFDFIVGADGVKVLKTNNRCDSLKFLYYLLQSDPIKSEGYKRHYSILKDKKIFLPIVSEQQKIAKLLTSIDKVIESKQQQITQAEQWKKGLMQGLFV